MEAKAVLIFIQATFLHKINLQHILNYYQMEKMEAIVMIMME